MAEERRRILTNALADPHPLQPEVEEPKLANPQFSVNGIITPGGGCFQKGPSGVAVGNRNPTPLVLLVKTAALLMQFIRGILRVKSDNLF